MSKKVKKLKENDFLSISARIRVLENRLLTAERMERMIDAKDAGDAAKVLGECGYPELGEVTNSALDAMLAQAQALAGRLKGVQVQIRARAGQGGKLFGSITSKEIAEELKRQFEIDVNKSKIVLSDPIKSFGSFEVKCKLGSEVSGVINVLVIEDRLEARSAREQAAKTRSGVDGFSARRAGKRRAQPQWLSRRRGGRAA